MTMAAVMMVEATLSQLKKGSLRGPPRVNDKLHLVLFKLNATGIAKSLGTQRAITPERSFRAAARCTDASSFKSGLLYLSHCEIKPLGSNLENQKTKTELAKTNAMVNQAQSSPRIPKFRHLDRQCEEGFRFDSDLTTRHWLRPCLYPLQR